MTDNLDMGKVGPVLAAFVVLVLSAILGYAWGASSAEIVDTGIWQLEISYQSIYLQATADAYAADHNDAQALERLSFICQENDGMNTVFDQAAQRYGAQDPTKQANLDQLRTLANSGAVQQNPDVGVCNFKSITRWAGIFRVLAPILLVLLAAGIVGYGVLGVIQESEEEVPAPKAAPKPAVAAAPAPAPAGGPPPSAAATTPAPAPSKPRAVLPGLGRRKPETEETVVSAASRGAQISAAAEKTDFSEPPLVQFMTTYLHGDDLYDDSFSIETPTGEFLGETGVGISEATGSGENKSVTAFEVWLFDKNDIRTVTKVLMSDHAFNDDAIRAKLAPKGEAVAAKKGDRIMLDTATLRVQARIVDLSYGLGAMPPNSQFERITIELAAWKREGQSAQPPGGGLPPSAIPPRGVPPSGGIPPSGLPQPPRGGGS
jgi:hypothetical protein